MKNLFSVLFFTAATVAHADGVGAPRLEPEVEARERCLWFGFIPCHIAQGGNDPYLDGPASQPIPEPEPEPQPEPEPEPEPKGKCK